MKINKKYLIILGLTILFVLIFVFASQKDYFNIFKEQPEEESVINNQSQRLIGEIYNSHAEKEGRFKEISINNDLYNIAKGKGDTDICLKINNELTKNLCLNEIAKNLKNEKICDIINEEQLRQECYGQIIFLDALENNNIALCEKVINEDLNKKCFNDISEKLFKVEECDVLEEKEQKNTCLSAVNYNLAINSNNREDCSIIYDGIIKAKCFSYFDEVSIYSDNDEDGLGYVQEIYYGTDFNNPDTDGDGYLDGDETKNGYNPLGEDNL